MNWYEESDWGLFEEIPVSNPDNTVVLTVDNGRGIATGSVSGDGNDRRIYEIGDFASADMEVRLDWETTGSGQAGVALRVQDGVAVVAWMNILFAATGALLLGTWEYDGSSLAQTNQATESVPGFTLDVLSAEGDGEAVTVRTVRPHGMPAAGMIVHFDQSVGSFEQVTVASVPDATAFTFASAEEGAWTGGTVRRVVSFGRRRVAARLVGDRLVAKQWLAGEAEPSWADPLRARSTVLPTPLASGAPAPSGPGGAGIIVAHLGDSNSVTVNDFTVQAL